MKQVLTGIASVAFGLIIWKIDSQPNWDDTGITVGMLLIATGLLGLINPKTPYIWAIGTCIWIPLFEIIYNQNYTTLLIFIFGFIGAYAGAGLRRSFQSIGVR